MSLTSSLGEDRWHCCITCLLTQQCHYVLARAQSAIKNSLLAPVKAVCIRAASSDFQQEFREGTSLPPLYPTLPWTPRAALLCLTSKSPCVYPLFSLPLDASPPTLNQTNGPGDVKENLKLCYILLFISSQHFFPSLGIKLMM